MSLRVHVEKRQEGIFVVTLDGRLDTNTYRLCDKRPAPLFDVSTKVLMFDMTKLNYISSMGLQVLFMARKAIEAHKGSVIMANLQPQITKVFEIVKALPPEAIFQSIEEADDYFDLMQRREIEKKNDSPEG